MGLVCYSQRMARMVLLIALVTLPLTAVFTQERQIEFSGTVWDVRRTISAEGPGPNLFSASQRSVWIDEIGNLHLRIREQNGTWLVAEVVSREGFGYGTYAFNVIGAIDSFDPQVVLGLFTYDHSDEQHHREIDIEIGRFGDTQRDAGQFAIQPFGADGHRHLFPLNLEGSHTTHAFSWNPDQILFVSVHGHSDDPFATASESPGRVIASWEYRGNDVPNPAAERIHINLWVYEGKPPSREHEVVIAGFSFHDE